ncbi:MAG: hypothetical protein EXR58_06910 [Chloroflexi bacterium]|nr:hypothetical protein [Chloroflexota bacterium]
MNHPAVSAPASAGPTGLIDTVQAGFNTINRHLWLLLLPFLIDVHLWLGPQLLIGTAFNDWNSSTSPAGDIAGTVERAMYDSDLPIADMPRVLDSLRRYNLFWLLSVPFLGIPSFRAGVLGNGALVPLDSLPTVAIASAAIVTLGFSLAVVFYGLLAQVIRTGTAAFSSFTADFGVLWVRAFALLLIVLATLLTLAVPVGFLLAGTVAAAPTLLTIVASLVLGAGVWFFVHLFFTPDALFLGRIGPVAAIRRSVMVVRSSFWQSMGFVGLMVIITSGFPIILHELARNLQTAGMVLAILGHIYISTAVTAASMTYYRNRFERLQPQETR